MKKNIVITILVVLVLGLSSFIAYDKFVKKEVKKSSNTNFNEKAEKVIEPEKNNDVIESNTERTETTETTETPAVKNCTGVYSRSVEGNHSPGKITVELKSNQEYSVNDFVMGKYRIVEDILLLKEAQDSCAPGETCDAIYTVNFISEDCSTIQWLYGSKRFPLTKQN